MAPLVFRLGLLTINVWLALELATAVPTANATQVVLAAIKIEIRLIMCFLLGRRPLSSSLSRTQRIN
jgi:hypothetical protein